MSILIVDDDPNIRWVLAQYLESNGYQVFQAENGEQGLDEWRKHSPDVILLDYKMPGMNGIDVLRAIRQEIEPNGSEVIIVTSHGETRAIVEAMKLGAADFIDKPFDIEEIGFVVKNVLEKKELKEEVKSLRKELNHEAAFQEFVGDSDSLVSIKKLVRQISDINATVLLVGESGTGKDMVARLIHNHSECSKKKFYQGKLRGFTGKSLGIRIVWL